jgi:hypothetical protein
MESAKQCAVIVRRSEDVWEGTRTSLALAAHNHCVSLYVVDCTVDMTDDLEENLAWLSELECKYYSNLGANGAYNFTVVPLEEMARDLGEMDLVIPFGNRT